MPCAQQVRNILPTSLNIQISQSPCTNLRRLTSQVQTFLTKSLNYTRPTEGHFRGYLPEFCTHVTQKKRFCGRLWENLEAADFVSCAIWQPFEKLQTLPGMNVKPAFEMHKVWQICKGRPYNKTTHLLPFSLLFLGIFVNCSNRFWLSDQSGPVAFTVSGSEWTTLF